VTHAQQAGISLPSATSGSGSSGTVINGEEFTSQVELYPDYLNLDPCLLEGAPTVNSEKSNPQALQDKLNAISYKRGDAHINGTLPVLEPLKARLFNSSWNCLDGTLSCQSQYFAWSHLSCQSRDHRPVHFDHQSRRRVSFGVHAVLL
jgi:3-oxoacyl-ACP reductase-like protein